jgi:hypothetical protein
LTANAAFAAPPAADIGAADSGAAEAGAAEVAGHSQGND